MENLTGSEGLIYLVPRGDEEAGGEDEGEKSERCGVEDAKEWDAGTFYMHAGTMGRIVLINIIIVACGEEDGC